MGRDDWFRNTDWNAETESAFRAKLSRSRSGRPQYLRIQASCLANEFPLISLGLVDEYFETGDEIFVSHALSTRAQACLALGRLDDAIAAYKRALDWEEAHPQFLSTAREDFPKLVAERRLYVEYDYALDILVNRFFPSDHLFPRARYLWNGSNALIAHDLGHVAEAREFAERALRAAAQTESPFRYHRSVGLVGDTSDGFGRRLKRIARPSMLRSLFRLISRA